MNWHAVIGWTGAFVVSLSIWTTIVWLVTNVGLYHLLS